MLRKLAALNPDAHWWIKGDGTDVVKGLWESVSGQWAGDVDLNDGKVKQLYKEFQDRITWVKRMGLDRATIEQIQEDLEKALELTSADIAFVTTGALTQN